MRKSLLIAAMFGMSVAASAQQTFTHITIKSGFNQDVICEDKDRITETTTQSDAPDLQGIDGSGFAFFTTGVQTNVLCVATTVCSSLRAPAPPSR